MKPNWQSTQGSMSQSPNIQTGNNGFDGNAREREALLRSVFANQGALQVGDNTSFVQLIENMKEGRYGGVRLTGDAPVAMMEMLKALGWAVSIKQLFGSMPHFPEKFGVPEIREVMDRMGFASVQRSYSSAEITEADLPALLVQDNSISVLVRKSDGGIIATDPQSGLERKLVQSTGTKIVSFSEKPDTLSRQGQDKSSWLSSLIRRFKREIGLLFVLTFAINLLVLISSFSVMAIYDKVIPTRATDTLVAIALGLTLSVSVELAFRKLKAKVIGQTAGRLEYSMGSAIFSKLISLPTQAVINAPIGDQVARLKQFESVRDLFSGPFAAIGLELPFIPLFAFFLFMFGGVLGWIPLAFIVAYLTIGLMTIGPVRRYSQQIAIAKKEQYQATFETISNIRLLRMIGCEEVWMRRLQNLTDASAVAKRKSNFLQRSLNAVSASTVPLAGGATSAIGAILVMNDQLTVGMLIASMIIVWRVLAPIQQLFSMLSRYAEISNMAMQLDRLMKLPSEKVENVSLFSNKFQGRITFDRVSFRYANVPDPTLQGLSFEIEPGELITVGGHSGAGKSTLLRLLLGLYQPQTGTIRIDEFNIRQFPISQLRGEIGYVPQNPALFHGTIAQNLRLANPAATDDQLHRICGQLGLSELIEAMPEGFNTLINHERNASLGGGFRQAIAIAQALLREPKILLLDEPAKLLDPELETAFIKTLHRCRGDVTSIMVSHRPSHIRMADRVLMLDRGSVQSFEAPEPGPQHNAA